MALLAITCVVLQYAAMPYGAVHCSVVHDLSGTMRRVLAVKEHKRRAVPLPSPRSSAGPSMVITPGLVSLPTASNSRILLDARYVMLRDVSAETVLADPVRHAAARGDVCQEVHA